MHLVRHADECRERFGEHLLHDAGAVDFDRLLRDAELGADLFVEQAAGDGVEDLPFTIGEALVAAEEVVGFVFLAEQLFVGRQRGARR